MSDNFNKSNGPFKATKMWNEVVSALRAGLPTRRHRRNIRVYDDCFTASDSVDWLHNYLDRHPAFKAASRDQTVQLLGKFLKNNIIEDIRYGSKMTTSTISRDFVDNKDLYRFCQFSPKKSVRTPLKEFVDNHASHFNKTIVSKTSTYKLNKEVPEWTQLPSVIEIENVWKKTFIEKLTSVLNVQKETEEKHFKDLFVNPKHLIYNVSRIGQSGIVDSLDRSLELPHWILSAMKCLMTWPRASGVESCLPNYPGFDKDVFKVVQNYFENLDEPLTTFSMYNMLVSVFILVEFNHVRHSDEFEIGLGSVDNLCTRMTRSSISDVRMARIRTLTPMLDITGASCPNLCLETDFESATPITHIIHSSNNGDHQKKTKKSDESSVLKVLLNESGGYVNLACNESVDSLCCRKTVSTGYVNLGCSELSANEEFEPLSLVVHKVERNQLRRSLSSANIPMAMEVSKVSDAIEERDLWTWNPSDTCLRRYLFDPLYTIEGKRRAVEAIQLCLLLLPPDNRRNLHRLLRFMVKMAENKQLQLDTGRFSNRKLVLDAFCKSVLRPASHLDIDEDFSTRFVSFLMDNHEAIFQAPVNLIASIDEQIADIGRNKTRLPDGVQHDGTPLRASTTYCEQMTEAEYERQKRQVSERAVTNLLDGIVGDHRLPYNEKRKKLKQFKKMYPTIYALKFPLDAPTSTKESAPVFTKRFKKLLEMRL